MSARVLAVVGLSMLAAMLVTACSTSPAWLTVTAEATAAVRATYDAINTATAIPRHATIEAHKTATASAPTPTPRPTPRRTPRQETCMELILMANDKILEATQTGFDSPKAASLTREANALLLRAERGDCK